MSKTKNLLILSQWLKFFIKSNIDVIQTILSGTRQSPTGMGQQHTTIQQASLIRKKAKIISSSAFKTLHVSLYSSIQIISNLKPNVKYKNTLGYSVVHFSFILQ